jgi:membrane-associated phospholipid phosphatase
MRRSLVELTLMIALLFVVPSSWAGQRPEFADDYPSDVASVWFDTLYDLVKSEAIAFPEASRIYGVSAVALYEAVVPGALHHRSLVGQLHGLGAVPQPREPELHHWPTVANAALADTIRGLFPSLTPKNLKAINALEERFAAQFRAEVMRPLRYQRSVTHGRAVAEAILAWAATDGFSLYNNCTYVPKRVRGAWEPTPPGFLEPQQPCWGNLRPMVLVSESECAPSGHPKFSKDSRSEFYAAAFEVYQTGLSLTKEQKTIAQYWADGPGTGTSSGHWIAIVGQIARNDGLSLAAAAEAYAKLGIAVADAFITIFHAKYFYNLVRPVTYIQDNIDNTWLPYLVTPPNPSYSSGHSTQSKAAAEVLTDLFGVRAFTDTTHTDHHVMPPQKPRTFSSFNQAAREAAVSRLYGGIHYAFDNDDGRSSGRCVGRAINNRVRFKD